MANGRNPGRKVDTGREGGSFIAMPHVVLESPAFTRLSHAARSLLWELALQNKGDNNGKLLASSRHLSTRGWNSVDVITRAKRELMSAGFIFETVKGHRPNKASWYALTWYTLDKNPKFDAGVEALFKRGAYKTTSPPLKIAPLRPAGGASHPYTAPANGATKTAPTPPDGPISMQCMQTPTPADGHHLEKPSEFIEPDQLRTQRQQPAPLLPCTA